MTTEDMFNEFDDTFSDFMYWQQNGFFKDDDFVKGLYVSAEKLFSLFANPGNLDMDKKEQEQICSVLFQAIATIEEQLSGVSINKLTKSLQEVA